jgi:hypothetical protein
LEDRSPLERLLFHGQQFLDEYGYVDLTDLSVNDRRELLQTMEEVGECCRECNEELRDSLPN